MAESNWFGSWITAAKDKIKNSEVLELVKKDLEEFGNAVKKEATNVMNSTGSVLEKTLKLDDSDSTASNMKRTFSSLLDQVQNALIPETEDSDSEAFVVLRESNTVSLSKFEKALQELQNNEVTFLLDPEEQLLKQYECWLEVMDGQIPELRKSKHLQESEVLQRQFDNLVPKQVSEEQFWKRYLFKKAFLEDNLARQEEIEKKKDKDTDEDVFPWTEEDFANGIELSEEEQIHLLEQYENETKQRNQIMSLASEIEKIENDALKENESSASLEEPAIAVNNSSSNSSLDDDWEKIADADK